ncbi:MAG: hypothetical protein Q4D73_03855 [Actinomycetaceae bacterium]|nr:hypothetical protein [Actinomycetaceae bacterium]
MPLFELDGGQLIPAQFGRTVDAGISPEILASVRDQVLEIIGRPLFPITWAEDVVGGQPRLTALDPSGQVVSVEVLPLLDSATMIESLSRLAETANMGWNELANAYPGGVHNFRFGWAEFRNLMPPSPAPGPRLILVVAEIVDAVRPVLDVLATSGVEVHELALREMSNGRRFVEVQAVGPRLYGHNPNLLLQSSGQLALPAQEVFKTAEKAAVSNSEAVAETTRENTLEKASEKTPEKAVYEPDLAEAKPAETDVELSVPEFLRTHPQEFKEGSLPSSLPKRTERRASRHSRVLEHSTDAAAGATNPAARNLASPNPTGANPASAGPVLTATPTPAVSAPPTPSEAAVETLQQDQMGLYAIAQIVGVETELVWRFSEVERFYAKLSPEGVIYTDKWSTTDPSEAVRLIGSVAPFDGWEVWRLGSASGPTLKEALEEINLEIKAAAQSTKHYQGRRVAGRANGIRVERTSPKRSTRGNNPAAERPLTRRRPSGSNF